MKKRMKFEICWRIEDYQNRAKEVVMYIYERLNDIQNNFIENNEDHGKKQAKEKENFHGQYLDDLQCDDNQANKHHQDIEKIDNKKENFGKRSSFSINDNVNSKNTLQEAVQINSDKIDFNKSLLTCNEKDMKSSKSLNLENKSAPDNNNGDKSHILENKKSKKISIVNDSNIRNIAKIANVGNTSIDTITEKQNAINQILDQSNLNINCYQINRIRISKIRENIINLNMDQKAIIDYQDSSNPDINIKKNQEIINISNYSDEVVDNNSFERIKEENNNFNHSNVNNLEDAAKVINPITQFVNNISNSYKDHQNINNDNNSICHLETSDKKSNSLLVKDYEHKDMNENQNEINLKKKVSNNDNIVSIAKKSKNEEIKNDIIKHTNKKISILNKRESLEDNKNNIINNFIKNSKNLISNFATKVNPFKHSRSKISFNNNQQNKTNIISKMKQLNNNMIQTIAKRHIPNPTSPVKNNEKENQIKNVSGMKKLNFTGYNINIIPLFTNNNNQTQKNLLKINNSYKNLPKTSYQKSIGENTNCLDKKLNLTQFKARKRDHNFIPSQKPNKDKSLIQRNILNNDSQKNEKLKAINEIMKKSNISTQETKYKILSEKISKNLMEHVVINGKHDTNTLNSNVNNNMNGHPDNNYDINIEKIFSNPLNNIKNIKPPTLKKQGIIYNLESSALGRSKNSSLYNKTINSDNQSVIKNNMTTHTIDLAPKNLNNNKSNLKNLNEFLNSKADDKNSLKNDFNNEKNKLKSTKSKNKYQIIDPAKKVLSSINTKNKSSMLFNIVKNTHQN